jgi:OFA family oxalate/formate antiporter-like MFS transporter
LTNTPPFDTKSLSLANFVGRVVGFLNVLVIRLRSLLLAAALSFESEMVLYRLRYLMKKYLILTLAVVIQLALGAGYAWSTFVPALKQDFGLTTAQTQTIFGLSSLVSTLLIFTGGRIQDRFGPRLPAIIGGILYGFGYILAGYSGGSYPALLISIGFFDAIGVGLCYLCPIACSVKWFPRHKSLVTGIAVAGYGGSAILVSSIGEYFLAQQVDVLTIFKYMGFCFLIVITIASMFLQNPPLENNGVPVNAGIRTADLFRDRNFWGLVCGIFPCLGIGLMIIGNIKPFGLALNLNLVAAGAAVSILAFFNATGRIIWGIIGGFLEGKKVILLSLISTSAVCLIAPFVVKDEITFYIFAMLAGFNYGACLVLYAAEIAHQYGTDQMGTIYSTLFLSNGIAGFLAPPVAGKIYDATGSYTPAFLIFGSLSFICIFLFYFIYQPEQFRK